ncbi:MAG: GNAT family N-acetyltransferase [Gammaproteobacteria bacterium]|nr:GNAT family N-acetyltransferase [Gammaproteobacteria bacterium]
MNIEVRVAKESDLELWDEVVNKSPHGTIFHQIEWLQIVETHTKSKLYPLIVYKGSEIVGIFPIFLQKKAFLKLVFSPPPKCAIPYLGPILVNYDDLKQNNKEKLLNEFIKQVDNFIFTEIRPNYVSFSLSYQLLDARFFKWNGYQIVPEYTYVLDLSKGTDNLWMQMSRHLRNEIKKASKVNIFVECGAKEDIFFVYNMVVERYREQNMQFPITKEYLCNIVNNFSENVKVVKVSDHNQIIGGIILINYKDVSLMWSGRYKTNYGNIAVNDYLQWECMRWLIKNNFGYFDLVGANTQRLIEYKAKYNPTLKTHFTVKKTKGLVTFVEYIYTNLIKPLKGRLIQF